MGTTFRSLNASDCKGKTAASQPGSASCSTGRQTVETVAAPASAAWAALLQATIATEIIPHILQSQLGAAPPPHSPDHPAPQDVAAFVDMILAEDMEQARAVADQVIELTGGREALLDEWLAPAARLLGEMWCQDTCDFTAVTLGVYRLDQIMKETATVGRDDSPAMAHDKSILLVPSPGEQHSFGLNMVADVFRETGWCVHSGPTTSRAALIKLVKDEWFDVVGLSVSADRALKGLPACIRAIRDSSRNAGVGVFVGGRAIVTHPERSRFLGADAMSNDPRQALAAANKLAGATVTEHRHRSKTKLVDIG